MIYLDYAATTPMSEHSLEIYVKAAKGAFGNSSSLHDIGGKAAQTLEAARSILATCIGGLDKGLYFTSGGSESNILAVRSLLNGADPAKKHIITTKIEHSSLYTFFKQIEEEGYNVSYLIPDKDGRITLNQLDKELKPETALVSIQHGNSEIGTIQPIEEFGPYLKQRNILFHSDCVQTFGKLKIDVKQSKIDAISVASHKIYGPKGIGAVYINPSVYWRPVLPGTTHESGFRPGTVDVPSAAAFAVAARHIHQTMDENMSHYRYLRERFIDYLLPLEGKITLINKHVDNTLPNIFPILVDGFEGQYLMLECNRFGYAVSTGSACQVGMQAPLRSLLAIGYDKQKAKQYIRISLGTETRECDLEAFAKQLYQIVNKSTNT